MYLPTDSDLMTSYVLAKQAETRGDRTMCQSWTILTHNLAVRRGYYGSAPAVEIDWEAWAMNQCTQPTPHWLKGSGPCPLHRD